MRVATENEQLMNWIKTTDMSDADKRRLEDLNTVLVCLLKEGKMFVDVAYWSNFHKRWACIDNCDYEGCNGSCDLKPTHWMPLPRPPKEQR